MRIQIDGTGVINKGAELMLYAIVNEVIQKYLMLIYCIMELGRFLVFLMGR